jgi:hypothetical protein
MPIFSDAIKKILTDGHAGHHVFASHKDLKDNPTVATHFTAAPSWNAANATDSSHLTLQN